MAQLFTPEITSFYEEYYENKGVQFIKGTIMSSFESDSQGKVSSEFSLTHLMDVEIGLKSRLSMLFFNFFFHM